MLNPFPGMDPYLEGPLWTTVHSNLVEEIARQLAPKLRPKYLALTNQRVLVAAPDPIEMRAMPQPLPTVPVPLMPGDADVLLDLQHALQTVYELFGYDQAADHTGEAAVPLPREQAAWAEARLRAAGLRS